jgi:hypothetical protein
LLNISQGDLAEMTGMSVHSVKRLEDFDTAVSAYPVTIEALVRAFGERGVEFIGSRRGLGEGVRFTINWQRRVSAPGDEKPVRPHRRRLKV